MNEEEKQSHEDAQLCLPFDIPPAEQPIRTQPNKYSLARLDDPYQEGGGFFYENCPAVFLGRAGYGPLRIAWDTNVLSDYADYGHLIWADDGFDPPVSESSYRTELAAFGILMELWMMRDIRVKVPERQIFDARRSLDDAMWELRERQIYELFAALRCIDLDTVISDNVPPFAVLPEGSTNDDWDKSLVLEAIENGCHVFLTGDKRLRRRLHQSAIESFVVIMPPSELVHALDQAGDLGFGGDGYILPDTHKWSHFMRATREGDADIW